MDIVIGTTQAPTWRTSSPPPPGSLQVEAKLLAVRPPRQKRKAVGTDEQRRNLQYANDPVGGQVLILLVPDKRALPRQLETGRFKVVLHFVPVHKEE